MRGFGAGLSLAAAGLLVIATPQAAQARYHYHHPYACTHRHAVAGTVIGAITGGVIGNAIGHGRPGGTIVGAGIGAVAGHQIGRNDRRC